MQITDRLQDLDHRLKIGLLAALLLGTGFVATSFGMNSSGDYSHAVERQNLAASGGKAVTDAALERSSGSTDSRKIVTTVRTTLGVSDVGKALSAIEKRAEELGGRVKSSSIDREMQVSGSLTVLVPDGNLSAFMTGLEDSYRVKSRSVDTEDVTDRHAELTSELETKKQELRRLRELMNRTDSVEELIKIQKRISELRSEIQYRQERLEDLNTEISYSRVYIDLEGKELIRTGFEVEEAFSQSFRGIFESLRLIIIGAGYLLPFGLIYLLYRLFERRRESD